MTTYGAATTGIGELREDTRGDTAEGAAVDPPPKGSALVETDPLYSEIAVAVATGLSGERSCSRALLEGLWPRAVADGDAFHRCVIAHYLADVQDRVADELAWDLRSLAEVDDIGPDRASAVHPSMSPDGFRPSLHLNVADALRRLGRIEEARAHNASAQAAAGALRADAYGAYTRAAIARQARALGGGG